MSNKLSLKSAIKSIEKEIIYELTKELYEQSSNPNKSNTPIPVDTKKMGKSANRVGKFKKGTLEFTVPYATYQYYGVHLKHPKKGATSHWVEVTLDSNKYTIAANKILKEKMDEIGKKSIK